MRFRPVKNEPVASEHVRREHGNSGLRSISRSRNGIGKEERSWALPGNCTLVIEGCASLCDLQVSLNGANPHARGALSILIALICKNDGSKGTALLPSCGMSYRSVALLAVA